MPAPPFPQCPQQRLESQPAASQVRKALLLLHCMTCQKTQQQISLKAASLPASHSDFSRLLTSFFSLLLRFAGMLWKQSTKYQVDRFLPLKVISRKWATLSPGLQSGVNTRLCNLMIKTPTPEIRQNLCYFLLTQFPVPGTVGCCSPRELSSSQGHCKGLPLHTGPACFAFNLTLGSVLPQWSFLKNTYVCVEKWKTKWWVAIS